MLARRTGNLQCFLSILWGFPFSFIPPIHLFDMSVLGKVAGEPRFVAQGNEI